MKIVRNDKVQVITGRDKGVSGKVLSVDPKGGKLIIEGVSVHKSHQRPRKQGEEGGIIAKPTPIYASKVMLVCPKCNKPTRVGVKYQENGDKIEKLRVCKKCGATISTISSKSKKKGE